MADNISDKHPDYSKHVTDWVFMRDSYEGQRVIKSKGATYLPMTKAMILDGADKNLDSIGYKDYLAYKERARYSNFVREAVQAAVGMMHSQDAEIKVPKAMEKIMSSRGESLLQLLRRINTEQLICGRLGLMADLKTNPTPEDLPYISVYSAERGINWDTGAVESVNRGLTLNLVVLDETENVRTGFTWEKKEKYRVLMLGTFEGAETAGQYRQGLFNITDNQMFNEAAMIAPNLRGREFPKIPFVFINTCDVTEEPDDPALLDLANICKTMYMSDADYRHTLHMQGQETLVTIGANFDETQKVRVGANARLDLPLGADAKFIGVKADSLSEQREALDVLDARAGTIGAQTLDTTSRERESGASLKVRVAARTADLGQIAEAGAKGLEEILKDIAVIMGENPDEISVKPNKEFGDLQLTGQDMLQMATAKNLGFPISNESLHRLAFARRVTKKTFDEEKTAAKDDKDSVFAPPVPPAPTGDSSSQNQQKQQGAGDQPPTKKGAA